MKILSVIVPCYQSQDYMEHCIKTLLTGKDDVEILIIDDGSKDHTLSIAQKYESEFPDIVRAIHQENKGHGGALNTGIANAKGIYLKVVDSDDWVNTDALKKILEELKEMIDSDETADLVVSNFVYEKQGAKRKKVINYRRYMKTGKTFTWKDTRGLPVTNYLMMHSMIYRTDLVKSCGLVLPEHTFYVDNIYVFNPLPFVRTIRYLDLNFYRYFIGRSDQSVQESVMVGRMDQHYRVTRILIDYMHKKRFMIKERSLRKTMYTNLKLAMAIATILAMLTDTPDSRKELKQIWRYLKNLDSRMYRRVRFSAIGIGVNLPGRLGRQIVLCCYHLLQRLYGFN
ncbi:glycosyltransferase family 2 protein [uncultured Robinsoniella sp.]|uniref:glycosyltransferase family 2 protein n=1 Tax=uncultured Robinsoniella sp. TaxID=904190 RepID=UPI00374F9907